MGRLRVNNIKNSTGTSGPIFTGPAEFSSTAHVVLPKGTTAERPANPATGALRYNTSTSQVEYWNGTSWIETTGYARDRGVFAGNFSAPLRSVMDYVTISSTGNATSFGNLSLGRYESGGCSSNTRGIFGGGYATPVISNVIDYITVATTGNATDFGDLTQARYGIGACSSSTRGVFAAGFIPGGVQNTIDYITIASVGNATDFGDLTVARYQPASCSSSTRGIFAGGFSPFGSPSSNLNVIDYITIASTGNATDFGDLTVRRYALAACSSSTRGVIGGEYNPVGNTIDYITIATTGNATDFGDLSVARYSLASCSNSTRGVFGGGLTPSIQNIIDYITIDTTGNAIDFGDLTFARSNFTALSDCHGGLS